MTKWLTGCSTSSGLPCAELQPGHLTLDKSRASGTEGSQGTMRDGKKGWPKMEEGG